MYYEQIYFKHIIKLALYTTDITYIIQIPHLCTSIQRGRQALCMKDSHISLQFNMVLLGFPPHLKQYSSFFVRSQIWHLNTPLTISVCKIHHMLKCLAGLHEPSHIQNSSEPSHFFVHLMHSVVRLEQSTISAAIAGPWHSGSMSGISACSR